MRIPLTAVVVLAAAAFATAAAAQNIQGSIVDDADERPLEGVHVVLLDAEGAAVEETLSDEEGHFFLPVPREGSWSITADLIGYGEVRSQVIDVALVEQVDVRIRMAVEAVALEPLVVVGRGRTVTGDLAGFYDRMERGRRSGMGRFIARTEIDDRMASHPTDLFQGQPSVRVLHGRPGRGDALRMAGNCAPAVYIDGSFINRHNPDDSIDQYLSVQSIEGIEIYRGGSSQVDRFYDPRGCGLILVWTRRGVPDEDGGPFSWKRLAAGIALVGAIFLLR